MLDNGQSCSKPRDKENPQRSHSHETFYNNRYKNQLKGSMMA